MANNFWRMRLAKSLTFMLSALLILSLFRVAFFFVFRSPEINFESFLPALVMGLRIDAKWVMTLFLPAWIALLCSYRWNNFWKVTVVFGVLAHIIAVTLALVNFGFYAFYGTPISPVIFGFFQDDTKAIVLTLLKDWPLFQYLFVAFVAVFLPCFIAGKLSRKSSSSLSRIQFASIGVVGSLAIALILRGSLGTFPLRYQDLSVSHIAFVNTTIPNGMIAMYEAYKGQRELTKRGTMKGGVNDGLREMGFADAKTAEDLLRNYRLNNESISEFERPDHVVVAVMESMCRELFELHSEDNNMLGSLKDELRDAAVFKKGIAVGSGTFSTVEGLLFNTPFSPLTQTKYGRQEFTFSHVQKYKKAGYKTVFLTAGPEKWRQLDETFKIQGFDEIIGASVIQARFPQVQAGTWGVPDEWMFRYGEELLQEADKKGEHLFVVMLSVTNHPPFAVPENYVLKPINTHRLPDYIVADRDSEKTIVPFQTYQYSSDALGQFVKTLRKSGLLKKSLMVATGDHNARFYKYHTEGNWHHALGVPIMFWLPENQQQLVKDADVSRWVTHVDIFPTLNALALNKKPELFEGRNLFSETDYDIAVTYFGFGEKGMAIGDQGAVAIHATGSQACYRWDGDRLVPEVPCSIELDRMGALARAQRGLADYQIRKDLLK